MKSLITVFVLFVFPILANGQNEVPRHNTIQSNSISIGLAGAPGWPLGLSYSQMLTP